MNRLLENGLISHLSCGTNFAYILNDNSRFFTTEYKVMQNQANSSLLKCKKMLYNGKIQLFYLTQNLKPFSSMIPSLDPERFFMITAGLLGSILSVRRNGFLTCQNVDISFDRIFVDPNTNKVSLVYVPCTVRVYDDEHVFENEVRTGLIKLINDVSNLYSPKNTQLAMHLANGLMSLDAVARWMGNDDSGAAVEPPVKTPVKKAGAARIVGLNTAMRVELKIAKTPFTIGKNPIAVDGVISFNKMISRTHCRVEKRDEQYYITDLQSANGTFVNGTRLQPNRAVPVKNGDRIRMANSDFQFITE